MTRRHWIYAAALLLLAVLAFVAAFAGLSLCAPAALPGDEGWALRRHLGEALMVATRGVDQFCFVGSGPGRVALWFAAGAPWIVGGLLLAILAWEFVGRPARLGWLRARGGHSILAGTFDDLSNLGRQQKALGPVLYLAADASQAQALGRHMPFAEIGVIGDRQQAVRQLRRFGANRARLLAAATRNDLGNLALAETALERPGLAELLVRLEEGSVRALSTSRLYERSAATGTALTVLSLSHLQSKRGMGAAMPGRYTIERKPRAHIVICGSGLGLQTTAFNIVLQGYGFDPEPPLISLIRTGSSDFSAGMLDRLVHSGAAEVRVANVSLASPGELDGTILSVIADTPPMLSIHCVTGNDAEAEGMALRWEATLLRQGKPIPPIIAYTGEDRPLGMTGMIRVATGDDLVNALEAERLMDSRSIAMHENYLETSKTAMADHFGLLPTHVPWGELPDIYREDNRRVAEQIDYNLAVAGMVSSRGGRSAPLPEDRTELLAEMAHARWLSAKLLTGWRYGPVRDNINRLHPDMLPYAELSEPVKQKDRDVVATLSVHAELAGESLLAERAIAVAEPLDAPTVDRLVAAIAASMRQDQIALAFVPLTGAEMVETAAFLLERDILVAAMIDDTTIALRKAGGGTAEQLANVLRRAWRIHVMIENPAASALEERTPELADDKGAIHARA